MGSSSSKAEKLPPWAPPSLRRKDVPSAYLELRHPNGSVAHVVGVRELSPRSVREARSTVRAARADSVLLELCDERVPPVWELLERGRSQGDGSIVQRLPELSARACRDDARLRRLGWWAQGLGLEGYASLVGTTLWAAQAVAAAEAARVGAQTHLIDRRQSISAQRTTIAGLESLVRGGEAASEDLGVLPPALEAAWLKATADKNLGQDDLARARHEARAAVAEGPIALAEPVATWLEAPAWRAAASRVLAERDEILAHRCWECLHALGAGGVAVAVVDERRLPGMKAHWGTTTAEGVKVKLAPRDPPAVLAAAAPFVAGASAVAVGISRLPDVPRRFALASLAVVPCVAVGIVSTRSVHQYNTVRDLQLRLDQCRA